ncbi:MULTISPECIES: FAD-dependent oxidoreductase [Enterobacteriaceae]|uniref:FAD-dependent oxidoreductase n=1 Tax=Raoultella lignicola TaxID=3040939 RepID=A0ABU9F9E4_9ENTR|nr:MULTISPECIES: FAD-dependent oxidoreductase [Enterobacteriaceae]MRT49350.1 FAD-dependent oxidoreductase [Raoultella sp. RIT712]QNK07360.1 FAD-dependent oxidoreductase [Enterobacter sp. JUb54]ROS10640.1 succinate dehydrogenase/fumarate reductase flavoprotein subunit [Raoultella sp. BIGb0399]
MAGELLVRECDVLVVGSGVGGLSAAVTAGLKGLDVQVIEKDRVFGGTTAFSGGVLWIPDNHLARQQGIEDSQEAARTYLQGEAGESYRPEMVEAFLRHGPQMLRFLEEKSRFRCNLYQYPDYHPDAPGGVMRGRSVVPEAFDIRALGPAMRRLRKPLRTITFMGMMFSSSNNDLKHFFNATRSLTSFIYVAKRLSRHLLELARYGRGVTANGGNAVVARLACSALDLGIPIHTGVAAKDLIVEQGVVRGVMVEHQGERIALYARRGVVLASGGFARDEPRLKKSYPHVRRGGSQLSPTPPGVDTGDGIAMAERIGARFDDSYRHGAAWIPASKVNIGRREYVFPHLVDRYKPGFIMVNRHGVRFCNEADSYHDVGIAMLETCREDTETFAWQICDRRALRQYGMGFAKPAPLPVSLYLKSGYLVAGKTLQQLAQKIGVPPAALENTVTTYNAAARQGKDPQFGRGESAYNRYLGDANHQPNPCVAPIEHGPFYAVKMFMGDLGTFHGLKTDANAQVLDNQGIAIPGLYAAGNEMASIMGGSYPGAGITLGPAATFGYIAACSLTALGETETMPQRAAS